MKAYATVYSYTLVTILLHGLRAKWRKTCHLPIIQIVKLNLKQFDFLYSKESSLGFPFSRYTLVKFASLW